MELEWYYRKMRNISMNKNQISDELTFFGLGNILLIMMVPFMRMTFLDRGIMVYFYFAYFILFFCGVAYTFLKFGNKIFSQKSRIDLLQISFLAFIFLLIISRVWLPDSTKQFFDINELKAQFFAILLFIYILNKKETRLLEYASFVSGIAIVILFLFYGSYYGGGIRLSIEIGGVILDPNMIVGSFIFPCLFCFDKVINPKKKFALIASIFYIALIVTMLYFTLLSGSRGGIIAILSAISLYYYLETKNNKKLIKATLIFVMIGIIGYNVIINVFPSDLIQRMSLNGIMATGGSGRFDIWHNYIFYYTGEGSILRLLFGYGQSGVITLFGFAAHQTFLEYIFEVGIVGFTIFIVLMAMAFRRGIKAHSAKGLSLLAGTLIWSLSISLNNQLIFYAALYMAFCLIKADETLLNEKKVVGI